jgi:hypothetical protein
MTIESEWVLLLGIVCLFAFACAVIWVANTASDLAYRTKAIEETRREYCRMMRTAAELMYEAEQRYKEINEKSDGAAKEETPPKGDDQVDQVFDE